MSDLLTKEQGAGRATHDAIEAVRKSSLRTADLGGTAKTMQVGKTMAVLVAA